MYNEIITPAMRRAAADLIATPAHLWTSEQRALKDQIRLKFGYRMLLKTGISRSEARKLARQIYGRKAGRIIEDLAIAKGMYGGQG